MKSEHADIVRFLRNSVSTTPAADLIEEQAKQLAEAEATVERVMECVDDFGRLVRNMVDELAHPPHTIMTES